MPHIPGALRDSTVQGPTTLRKYASQGEKQVGKQGAKPSPPTQGVSSGGFPPRSRRRSAAGGGEALSNSHLFLLRPPTPTAPPSPPPKPGSLPRPSLGLSQTPQECSPVTCAAAAVDVPLPPRPKETQRHLALTQLQKLREKAGLLVRASAPKFRRGRARALTSRRERRKWSGRALRFPSPLLGFHISRGSNDPHRHFSLSAFATASPYAFGPTRCCRMRSSLANNDAPNRPRRAPIGCRERLCLSPLSLPSALGRCGAEGRRKPPFRGKDPENKSRNRRVIFKGETLVLFFGPPPFFFEITVSLSLPRLITAT